MIIHKVFSALGTINTISLNCDETYHSKAVCLLNAAESYVLDMDRRLSVFSEDSEISNINKNAGKASVKVSADTLEILKQAENYKKLTHGAFDICAKTRGKVKIYESRSEVKLTTHNREADLGGIAKGYAIDTLLKLFENAKHCKIIFKSRTARLARRIRSAQADKFPFRIRAHPRGAFISVGDWTPTELSLL